MQTNYLHKNFTFIKLQNYSWVLSNIFVSLIIWKKKPLTKRQKQTNKIYYHRLLNWFFT